MRTRAFTLIEVMVSLVIFATAAIVLGAGYLNVLHAYELADRGDAHAEDVRFARAQLLVESDREKAEDGGEFESNGAQVHWHATIEPTTTADLFAVTFVCEFSDPGTGAPPPPVTETFMLLRPTWSQGGDAAKLKQEAKDRIAELQKRTP